MTARHVKNKLEKRAGGRKLSVFERHELRIARDTLKMPEVMVGVMGGPTKEEARASILRLTGKLPKE